MTAAVAMLAVACGSGDTTTDEATAESPATTTAASPATTTAAAPTTSAAVPATTAAPTTAAPTTTAGSEEAATVSRADVRIEADVSLESGVGSFEVVEGTDALGCERGEFYAYPLSGNSYIDLTCQAGGSGTWTLLQWFTTSSDQWRAVDGDGSFAGIFGYGDFLFDFSDDTAVGEVWGEVSTGGPVDRATPSQQIDRLVDEQSPCNWGFVSTDGLYEYATVDDVLQSLDLITGEIVDHGPAPTTCAMWLGDPVSGRAVALDPTTFGTLWLGPLGGDLETRVELDAPIDILSRSIRANRLLVSSGEEVNILDATTGELVGEPIVGDAGTGRTFAA
ncbi:MAG: hypothetical protein AAGG08_18505, partial [Actinomycetota bacterium]